MPLDLYDSIRDQRLAALRADFFPRLPPATETPLTLELGCGHGHYLNAYAAAHPNEFCVGLDLIADRIARAERKATRARLTNLIFVQAEAALFLSALNALDDQAAGAGTASSAGAPSPGSLPPQSASLPVVDPAALPAPPSLRPIGAERPSPRLRRIFVLFSDPWPKRRHWKHRVLQGTLLDALAALTETGATLHFRTDHPDYFNYAREVVAEHAHWRLAQPEEAPWPFEYVSVFEERALAGIPQSFTALRR